MAFGFNENIQPRTDVSAIATALASQGRRNPFEAIGNEMSNLANIIDSRASQKAQMDFQAEQSRLAREQQQQQFDISSALQGQRLANEYAYQQDQLAQQKAQNELANALAQKKYDLDVLKQKETKLDPKAVELGQVAKQQVPSEYESSFFKVFSPEMSEEQANLYKSNFGLMASSIPDFNIGRFTLLEPEDQLNLVNAFAKSQGRPTIDKKEGLFWDSFETINFLDEQRKFELEKLNQESKGLFDGGVQTTDGNVDLLENLKKRRALAQKLRLEQQLKN